LDTNLSSVGEVHDAALALMNGELSEAEELRYGGRFLSGYEKLSLIARGGFGIVWKARKSGNAEEVAVKQVAKTASRPHDIEAAKRELWIADLLFGTAGASGVCHVIRVLEKSETKSDYWLVMEHGGQPLTKVLFTTKGEFHRGERVYRLVDQPLYKAMLAQVIPDNWSSAEAPLFVQLAQQLLRALEGLAARGVVHADIKPDNILATAPEKGVQLRLADFGSSFSWDNVGSSISTAVGTPEYMSPERLDRTILPGPAWAIDTWSVGCILLEVIHGVPLWLAYKVLVARQGKELISKGLLAHQGRDGTKILKLQRQLVPRLGNVIADAPGLAMPPSAAAFISALMALTPQHRPHPTEALANSFITGYTAKPRSPVAKREDSFDVSLADTPVSSPLRGMRLSPSREAIRFSPSREAIRLSPSREAQRLSPSREAPSIVSLADSPFTCARAPPVVSPFGYA
jgi:serine/threonine protein kinase